MQMRYVKLAAQEGGIGLDGVRVKIIRDVEAKGSGFLGDAHPDGKTIQLFPDAFTNTETLIKTLGHERTHIWQIKTYGHPNKYSSNPVEINRQFKLNETAAYKLEDSYWQYYQKHKSGKMGGFE